MDKQAILDEIESAYLEAETKRLSISLSTIEDIINRHIPDDSVTLSRIAELEAENKRLRDGINEHSYTGFDSELYALLDGEQEQSDE